MGATETDRMSGLGDATTIGGLPITALGMQASARCLIDAALGARGLGQRPFYATSANGQVIALARSDAAFRSLLLAADQIHADGMPMVLLSPLVSQAPLPERVATTDLVHAVATLAQKDGVSFSFLGGTTSANACRLAPCCTSTGTAIGSRTGTSAQLTSRMGCASGKA